jgi:hypothetical protein
MNETTKTIDDQPELTAALIRFHTGVKNPSKDRDNPYFNSKYATLDALQDASRTGLAQCDLCITQVCRPVRQTNDIGNSIVKPLEYTKIIKTDDKGRSWEEVVPAPIMWELHTVLMHKSGQFIQSVMPLVQATLGPQKFGSELTYMRRYAYAAILSMTADEDDDGNQAQGNDEKKPEPKKKAKGQDKKADDLLESPPATPAEEYKDTEGKPDGIPELDPVPEMPKTELEINEFDPVAEVRLRLNEDKNTEERFMILLRKFALTKAASLEAVDKKVLETILGKWGTVQKNITKG